MKILALDLATKTGWATWDGKRMESGVQDFTKKRGDSNGMLFINFNSWLERISFPWVGWNFILWEQAHHRGGPATEIGVGLSTRMQEFCARTGVEHTTVHSLTLKKWATGRGNAKKPDMILEASVYKWKTLEEVKDLDDNEADAILLLQYAIKEILGERACTALTANAKPESKTLANTAL